MMVSIIELWPAILASAVLVFIASSAIHMLPLWHKNDYPKLPNQDALMDAVRPLNVAPGDYLVPRAASPQEMKSSEFAAKHAKGPAMILTVFPAGPLGMGKQLLGWFVFTIVVSIFVAYVAGRALNSGESYLQVHQTAGAVAFGCYAFGAWPMSIWYRRAWGLAGKETLDSLIYGMLTGGAFGWLWP
jgi:hypothetical protein